MLSLARRAVVFAIQNAPFGVSPSQRGDTKQPPTRNTASTRQDETRKKNDTVLRLDVVENRDTSRPSVVELNQVLVK